MIAHTLQSSAHHTTTDDRLKDEDNAGWLLSLPEPERGEWLTVLEWIRSADRLLESSPDHFADYLGEWRALRSGVIDPYSKHRDLFERISSRWARDAVPERELKAWDGYLHAQWDYRVPERVIRCEHDYRTALFRMSSGIFQALPFKPRELHEVVGWLGALDQFFNNLRDLREDVDRGLCYLPDDLLARFDLRRDELPRLVTSADPRFAQLWDYELRTYVPTLRARLAPLFTAPNLHPTWAEMLKRLQQRHHRIEAVARWCRFDATVFARQYWQLVTC